jgi:hypothetical protein
MAKVKPTEIVDYWSNQEREDGLSVDWADAAERCWRCSERPSTSQGSRPLELCHIVPSALGGKDEPWNFVLLCWRCHLEAPNVSDPSYMWVWLRAHAQSFYETYWMTRATEEFQKLFGCKPGTMLLEHAQRNGFGEAAAAARYEEALSGMHHGAVFHWGQGHLNPATLACLMHLAETDAVEKWRSE